LSEQEEIGKQPQKATTYFFTIVDLANDVIFELAEDKEVKESVRKRSIISHENSRNVVDLINNLCDFISDLMKNSLMKKRDNINIHVQQTREYLKSHYSEKISLDSIARQMKISPAHLSSIFKKEIGIGFSRYLINVRMEEAKKYLRSSRYSLKEIANAVGYNDAGYFSVLFKKETGISPGEFRRLHQFRI
ncbi:MAG: helix-turn-helix transcriptional regulator, partial [Erysipelotrichaceae bacterium]|nr:helix-turn-helix transcriptional regulator [Erysipelotrichaceae bacterium]